MGIPGDVNIWKTSAIESFRELLVLVHSEFLTGAISRVFIVKELGLEKLGTRVDHRTNPSAIYRGFGLSRPSSSITN
jgi:hypothetical protein